MFVKLEITTVLNLKRLTEKNAEEVRRKTKKNCNEFFIKNMKSRVQSETVQSAFSEILQEKKKTVLFNKCLMLFSASKNTLVTISF